MPDDPRDDDELPAPLAFLGDADAFVRRYVLSLVLQPPPSRRHRGARPPAPPPAPAPLKKK